jgi:hypothetical protein
MGDFIIDELPTQLPQRKGPTGPRTSEGKAKSSKNSLQHGSRSPKTVLPDENPAEFEATVQRWFTQYEPDTPAAISLVEKLARAEWQLKRTQNRLDEAEWQLPADVHDWTEDQHKRLVNLNRYHTTAERSFLRYFKEIEAYYHRSHRDDQARQLAFAKLAGIQFKSLDKADEAALKEVREQQIVEVQVINGTCETTCYPTNEKLIESVAKRPTPPIYIARWILFVDGIVPAEYTWAQPVRIKDGLIPQLMQRMLWPQWLELIEREQSGHAGPIHSR